MSKVIHKFTRTVPGWQPRVTPVRLDEATPEQLDALKVTPSNTKVSDYVLVLAHDPESLDARSPLFNAVMYGKGGLDRAGREIGALGPSIINRCIYCAAVHAQRHAQISKDTSVTDEIFRAGPAAKLNPRDQAMFDFSVKLAATPPQIGPEDMAALRDAGLDDLEISDLILASAMFGWANRLMHVLGDPVRQDG